MSAAKDDARPGPQRGRLLIFAVAAACLMLVVTSDSQAVRSAAAEEPWSISSFDAHYTVNRDGSITSSEDHDEFYWNVTGHEWPVTIDKAIAKVELPEPGISEIACFQGPTGSRDVCQSSGDRQNATFASTIALHSGSELTLTVGLKKGLVDVPAPTLKSIEPEGVLDKLADFFRFTPLIAVFFVLSSLLILGFLVRQWWITGRD